MGNVDLEKLVRLEEVSGETHKETQALMEMAVEAENYLKSFSWCPPIKQIYLGCGISGVVASFFIEFKKAVDEDLGLWVIVGDVPSAYLVADNAPTPARALEVYCSLMDDWANAILSGKSRKEAYPVDAKPTKVNARSLKNRVAYIRKEIIPWCEESDKS